METADIAGYTNQFSTIQDDPFIAASVFITDDERRLHADYEKSLEALAPHAPTSQCRPRGRLHNRTGQACPRGTKGQAADAHLKRHGPPGEAVVVAVTYGRLGFGTWERIF